MPGCLLLSYYDEMPRNRALRILDGAQSALYAQLVKTKEGGQAWLGRWLGLAQQGARRNASNNVREVKTWLRQMLGGGFSE